MELQNSDSKKLFKVFDASKRKRGRKNSFEDNNSVATDESGKSFCQNKGRGLPSNKGSSQDVPTCDGHGDISGDINANRRRCFLDDTIRHGRTFKVYPTPLQRDQEKCSPSGSRSPTGHRHRERESTRRSRRTARDGVSLALKAGLVSTPRSISPEQEPDCLDSIPKDQDSFIYAFLEDAVKRDKRKHRHAKKRESRTNRERDISGTRERSHRTRDDHSYRDKEKSNEECRQPIVDQSVLLETFAKLCAQISEKSARTTHEVVAVPRTLSHKSLQCEVTSRQDSYQMEAKPKHIRSRVLSRDISPACTRSNDNFTSKVRSRDNVTAPGIDKEKFPCSPYAKESSRYLNKLDVSRANAHEARHENRYGESSDYKPVRNSMNQYYRNHESRQKDYKDYDELQDERYGYYEDRPKYCERKTSRSFEMQKDNIHDENIKKSSRSDSLKAKDYDERYLRGRRKDEKHLKERYYGERELRERNYSQFKERRDRRNIEKCDRSSSASREEDYKDRDRYVERERDSGLSVADGETSTISGRSNYLKVVKQEITEQREAMDKMMNLWKELMRCFKGVQPVPCKDKEELETAENVQESAAAQLTLWRECMRRYETVARDVGDTDARLKEEINKQRTEMAEMGSMWQECLQRYRDMSNEFNNLKEQLASVSPTRAPQPPLVCAEGEGVPPSAPYRMPPNMPYPPMQSMPSMPTGYHGSPLRSRASAPPWWWNGEPAGPEPPAPRRRSPPDSSRERRHRHKDRERDTSRHKDKPSKPSAARSEHRHRKR
ncbi:serine/arginine repetitive matrix protein 1-like isoform X3 [Leptidea sinapis]|uniref:serine/arginine repetitive matrix protein 1-like isoform X3 n=1 Tax=Leptidea sinapis TaxID=189913 RepID=UPI0021C379E5|nr:serine/arginine repetitive matrix protein 1-like isoform X3 [Leptidea sinapis]